MKPNPELWKKLKDDRHSWRREETEKHQKRKETTTCCLKREDESEGWPEMRTLGLIPLSLLHEEAFKSESSSSR